MKSPFKDDGEEVCHLDKVVGAVAVGGKEREQAEEEGRPVITIIILISSITIIFVTTIFIISSITIIFVTTIIISSSIITIIFVITSSIIAIIVVTIIIISSSIIIIIMVTTNCTRTQWTRLRSGEQLVLHLSRRPRRTG